MRHDELYIRDMVEAAAAIETFLVGVTREAFLDSDLLRSAVLHKLTIIGEAASRISREFANRFPEVEWAAISGFRNIAVHEYFAVDWKIVWVGATKEAPILGAQINEILKKEFPE
ncbi:MAG: HepT-like ribonuclease domain-containing protein [Blastocatellia bacterium]|nr:HepT-like ribonuclease domain-containing protein [Blastocatellia bacterium]